mmetsp:Transcript_75027/g.207726  ORF Transcript_75027/g.207726 Transcript_75027/m.207726 type:complete len:260 (+) Transcript_75027:146-925(+)
MSVHSGRAPARARLHSVEDIERCFASVVRKAGDGDAASLELHAVPPETWEAAAKLAWGVLVVRGAGSPDRPVRGTASRAEAADAVGSLRGGAGASGGAGSGEGDSPPSPALMEALAASEKTFEREDSEAQIMLYAVQESLAAAKRKVLEESLKEWLVINLERALSEAEDSEWLKETVATCPPLVYLEQSDDDINASIREMHEASLEAARFDAEGGFAGATLRAVCREQGLDVSTMLPGIDASTMLPTPPREVAAASAAP